ncbi:hypothetical protein ASE39_00295 [Acidovorax sp. Root267]|uniref:hypothetical protein n=1 Tax=Acidovorax sp. Root267 TaxID=1736505 RepID=UPI00070F1A2F|nr:hypothetical protein [Acidovorax sp. Root267]KRD26792.1 hypothetical protein ASE39_00295 [Acidovorax sp. Root267]
MPILRFVTLADVAHLLPVDGPMAELLSSEPDAWADATVAWVTGDVHWSELSLDTPLQAGGAMRALAQATSGAKGPPPGGVRLILIEGNLQIDGALTSSDTHGSSHLVVLGSVQVAHAVVGGQLLHVQGALQVHGLLWGDGEPGELRVNGGLSARVALFTEAYALHLAGGEDVEFLLDEVRGVPSLVEFSSEAAGLVFAPGFFNGIDDGEGGLAELFDRDRVVAAVRSGESPVRSSSDIHNDLPLASDLFADEAISVANILAAVNSDALAPEEHHVRDWFGQTHFSLCRRHVDGDGNPHDDRVYMTVWKTWDFYMGVVQEPAPPTRRPGRVAGKLQRPAPVVPAVPVAERLSVLYRPYDDGVAGDWRGLDEAADPEAHEACTQAWRGVIDYVRRAVGQSRAGYPLYRRLKAEITTKRIERFTQLPVFTEEYNDWWDADKRGTWFDDVWVGARQPGMHEGEFWCRALDVSWENGEDAPGDAEHDAHGAYQIDIDRPGEGREPVEFTYSQRQSENRPPLPCGAADHIARLLRLYGMVEAPLLQAYAEQLAEQAQERAAQAEARRIEAAVHLLATQPLAHGLPDEAVFPPELLALSEEWQAGGQAYVAAIRAYQLAEQAAAAAAEAAGYQAPGWDNDEGAGRNGPNDTLPDDPRKASAATVLQLARVVNRHADEALTERFRQRFAFAPDAYVHLAADQGPSIGPVFWLPDGDGVVARIGAEHSDDARWVRLQGPALTPLPALKGLGRSHDGRCFALSDGTHITTHQGFGGPQIAQLPLPQGNEGLPASLGLAAGELGQRCDEVIPFNDGQRALLRNPTGVYLLTPAGVQRIHPQEFDEDGPYSWPKNQMQEVGESDDDDDNEDENGDGDDDGDGGEDERENTGPRQLALCMLHMALSPDERHIALGDQDSRHILLDAQGKVLRALFTDDYPHHTRFSHDSALLWANSCHFYNGCTVASRVDDAQDSEGTLIDSEWRVYASATLPGMVIVGDAHGYLHARDDAGKALWRHHIGSTISAVEVSPDGSLLLVGSYGGYLVLLQRSETEMDRYSIGNSPYVELRRWIFWDAEAAPLRW